METIEDDGKKTEVPLNSSSIGHIATPAQCRIFDRGFRDGETCRMQYLTLRLPGSLLWFKYFSETSVVQIHASYWGKFISEIVNGPGWCNALAEYRVMGYWGATQRNPKKFLRGHMAGGSTRNVICAQSQEHHDHVDRRNRSCRFEDESILLYDSEIIKSYIIYKYMIFTGRGMGPPWPLFF